MPRYSVDLTLDEVKQVRAIAKGEDRTLASMLRCFVRRQLHVVSLLENGAKQLRNSKDMDIGLRAPVSSSQKEEEKSKKKKETGLAPLAVSKEILGYLNATAGTNVQHKAVSHRRLIQARLNDGATVEDFKTVIRKKCAEWLGKTMQTNLKPSTLFAACHFDDYLGQLEPVGGGQGRQSTVELQGTQQDFAPRGDWK